MKEFENQIQGKTVEEKLVEVKNGLANGNMTKEQVELMIRKCDILIKKNKKIVDRYEKVQSANATIVNEEQEVILCGYWEEELFDTLVFRDECDGSSVRNTISEWFGVDLEKYDDGIYFLDEDKGPEMVCFFSEEDDTLECLAVRYEGRADAVKQDFVECYQQKKTHWYDRRSGFELKIYNEEKDGFWLLHRLPGFRDYAVAIADFEKREEENNNNN